MRILSTTAIIVLAIVAIAACSILKKEDPEKKVRAFLTEFEQSLGQNDDAVLAYFDVAQSKEAVLSAVRVLQNTDSWGIRCEANFSQATVAFEDAGIHIDIPAQISVDTLEIATTENATLTLWLHPDKDKFKISKLEGEAFYNQYLSVKGQVGRAVSEIELIELHNHYFETVKKLQETYDTVVWAVNHNSMDYYYVVNGTWTEDRSSDYTMGLVDGDGRIIVPVEFNLIGTPGFISEDIVEVKKFGLVGYYQIDGKPLIAAKYEWLIPYNDNEVYALAKTDTSYGWINTSFQFKSGLPSKEAEKFISNYEYLPDQLTLSNNNQSMCEIPNVEYIGSGILIPPSYLTHSGLFQEVIGGFALGNNMYRGNTESIEASHSFIESVADHINVIITTVTERYLEGREGFYTRNEVAFVNDKREIVASSADLGSGALTFKKIDSTYIEIQTVSNSENMDYFDDTDDSEMDIPVYSYYRLTGEGSLEQVSSNRIFTFTEFVKLDSSYVTGNFSYYDANTQSTAYRQVLSEKTLQKMRNEILAEYGYIFKDEETSNYFKYFKWYNPRYNSLEQLEQNLSDTDRYNLKFLEKMAGPLPGEEQV
jgi:hypothetical protein